MLLEDYFFISSPKLRAIETAKPLAKKFNKKVKIDNCFIEIPAEGIKPDKKQEWLEQIVQTNITMPKVDSLEKIPLFVTRLDTRVLTIIDPQMPDGNIDIGTITVNIGHFIVDETL